MLKPTPNKPTAFYNSAALWLALSLSAACGFGADPSGESLSVTPAAITYGAPALNDPGVVAVAKEFGFFPHCSGTLVAPRVVLTAAHCVVSTTVGESEPAVFFGITTDDEDGVWVETIHVHAHPDFVRETLENDLALLLLDRAAPATPWPLYTGGLAANHIGTALRLVGFGVDENGANLGKREGVGKLDAYTDTELSFTASPSLTCDGDSGGPAFMKVDAVEYVVGVTSGGDAACVEIGRDIRVDAYAASFLQPYLDATAEGMAASGARCYYDANCQEGSCFFPDDAASVGYCSAICVLENDCAEGMRCVEQRCKHPTPSPGAIGTPCVSRNDCDSALCPASPSGAELTCSKVCDGSGDCPSGFDCLPLNEASVVSACFPEEGGGCSSTPHPSTGLAVLAALWLVSGRRRRRRTARC